ncbi:hypothetical protein [Cryptosporangium arvum]|uniref:hypothetical protein n=1 Tax=Cryptosporangium arvum TaxID=80871 RepID=UPI0004B54727|nr:hypothetical protein [Cryptosporangium arvum]
MPDLSELAAVAARALHPRFGAVTLTPTTPLTSSRSTVFRAHLRPAGVLGSVVVKAPTGSAPWRERAALDVLGRAGVGGVPELLAGSDDPPLIVLADAGTGPSLADRLLGTDPDAATDALLTWAGATATLQASTAGLAVPFTEALAAASAFGAPPADTSAEDLAEAAAALATHLPQLGVTPGPAALEALRTVPAALPADGSALDPGDACPDNNVETADGLILLDFEFAAHRHVAWHAAYLRVPWPTCWCSWRLPPEVARRALDRWRTTLAPTVPAVATPAFEATLDLVTAAWALLSVSWFLPLALAGDPPTTEPTRPRPSRRQMVQSRLDTLAQLPLPAGYEPLRRLGAEAYDATVRVWGPQPMPLAPAYR